MLAKEGWDQLSTLRRMVTEPMNALHQAQIIQLKFWPFIAAPHIKKHETSWDMEKKLIEIRAVSGKDKPLKNLSSRMAALLRSVQDMLGELWQVIFFVDEKVIFDSRKKTNGTNKKKRSSPRSASKSRVKRP